ncbi:MAG: PilT/PilU family type 4a pilus ATPase, partial [Pseudomonadales bacterium]|nr:PilT/PilU family type 4a pilus ATPase [Pseudomonadales bacterium]
NNQKWEKGMSVFELPALLEDMVLNNASDLFLSVGTRPMLKIEGCLRPVGASLLDSSSIHSLCYSVLNEKQRKTFEATNELNMSLQIKNIGRFRINVFRQKGDIALVARHINNNIPSIEQLNLPDVLKALMQEHQGLVLIVGGTGSGKSSALASMIDYKNALSHCHILTIEDPVEFVHAHNKAMVNQREVGLDTDSYAVALKNAMREAPDIIMIGEIRDAETMKHALAYSETGHLCLSTLHANNANQSIERILNFFSETSQSQILQDIAINLKAIVSMRLVVGVNQKRVPAVEVLLNTPYISELIHLGKIEKIKEAMGQAAELGCKTLDDALFDLAHEGKITQAEALKHADSRTNLQLRFRLEEDSGKNHFVSGLKKDIAFAKNAEFKAYKTYRIKCSRFNSVRSEIKAQIEHALNRAMKLKEFVFQDENPDLEVQFAFNAQPVHLELETVTEEYQLVRDSADNQTDDNLHETILINVFDMHRGKPIWRVKAGAVLRNEEKPQLVVNEEIMELMDNFPPN